MATEQQAAQFLMENPKPSTDVFLLPCGYIDPQGNLHTEITVREMNGGDEDLLASQKSKTPAVVRFNELLCRCTTRVGPYTDRGQLSTIVSDLVMGDRVFLLLCIRRVTLGDTLPFRAACPHCEKENLFTVDLSELDIKRMADPKLRLFDKVLPSGKAMRFHVLTGRDELKQSQVAQGNDPVTASILMRTDLLDGKPPVLEDIKALSFKDVAAARGFFEEVEAGVDTTVQVDCPECSQEFDRDVSPGEVGFFFPDRVRKNSKTKSSG
jgi:hypothetical protein